LLEELGVDPHRIDLGRWKTRPQLVLHIVLCDSLSVEMHWKEVELLDVIFHHVPCRLVCIESGTRLDDVRHVKEGSTFEAQRRVGARYFHDLVIGPAEFLQLTTDIPFSLWGIDSKEEQLAMLARKQAGLPAADLVGAVSRAQGILERTLEHLRATETPIAVLITHRVGGFQLARLLGEENQFDLDLTSRLPSIPRHLVKKRNDLLYVAVMMDEPTGDLFDIDVNYLHSTLGTVA
jgi:hypothetical protein